MQRNTQRLERSFTPWSAVPAPCPVVEGLNSSERVRAVSFNAKTPSNNPEEHLHSGKSEQDLRVPVLNIGISVIQFLILAKKTQLSD